MEEDIREAAKRACSLCGITPHSDMRVFAEQVAAVAIEQERNRCVAISYQLCAEEREVKLAYRIRNSIMNETTPEFWLFDPNQE